MTPQPLLPTTTYHPGARHLYYTSLTTQLPRLPRLVLPLPPGGTATAPTTPAPAALFDHSFCTLPERYLIAPTRTCRAPHLPHCTPHCHARYTRHTTRVCLADATLKPSFDVGNAGIHADLRARKTLTPPRHHTLPTTPAPTPALNAIPLHRLTPPATPHSCQPRNHRPWRPLRVPWYCSWLGVVVRCCLQDNWFRRSVID